MIKVEGGNGQISATVIAHSKSSVDGSDMITYEIEYPRIILAELNTHRQLSKNSSSSRAIPVKTILDMIRKSPAMPVRFGQHQPGMQDQGKEFDATVTLDRCNKVSGRMAWETAANRAADIAEAMAEAGYSKQVVNRLNEPFQRMKTVISGTEWNNFFWLRCHEDADPTIESLASTIREAFSKSVPEVLQPGQWHTPYVSHLKDEDGNFAGYYVEDEQGNKVMLDVEEAKAISSSCCAQVSYRRLNATKDKALDIYDRLVNGAVVHGSPFEHIATPMQEKEEKHVELYCGKMSGFTNVPSMVESWEKGITHMDREGKLWSGNLCGWIQHRQLIPGNAFGK